MKTFYALLCAVGLVLSYWQFLTWIAENGSSRTNKPAALLRRPKYRQNALIITAQALIASITATIIGIGVSFRLADRWISVSSMCGSRCDFLL